MADNVWPSNCRDVINYLKRASYVHEAVDIHTDLGTKILKQDDTGHVTAESLANDLQQLQQAGSAELADGEVKYVMELDAWQTHKHDFPTLEAVDRVKNLRRVVSNMRIRTPVKHDRTRSRGRGGR